jgi:type IV pilus assembly protein PilZ
MFELASEETFKKGDIIFKENSSGDWVYVIISGSVEISKTAGGKKFVVAILHKDEVFGELSFLGGIKRTATAQALEDVTLGVIERSYLDSEFNKISSDFRSILVASVRRFEKMLERACDFTSRQDPRVPKVLSLSYKDRDSFIKAYTSNISKGGVFIKTDNPLPAEEQFVLKLQLPDIPESLKIKCQVAWRRKNVQETERKPNGMGVKFEEMSKSDSEVLNKYIQDITKP